MFPGPLWSRVLQQFASLPLYQQIVESLVIEELRLSAYMELQGADSASETLDCAH